MKKFLPFSRQNHLLEHRALHRGWSTTERFGGKSIRKISATSLSSRSIQVVRGAYNIDLTKVDNKFTKLHRACLLNDESLVKKNLHKVDCNSHDSSNRFPIHLATVNGNFAIVKLLIENGADPNVQDNEGNTPLIKSIECGHEHLIKYLVSSGADPNLSDLDNNTALHWALRSESIVAIDTLLGSKKCDLKIRNHRDETCLHVAVRSPLICASTFETLIKGGSDLGATDQLGLTAYEVAMACNNSNAIQALNNCCENRSGLTLESSDMIDKQHSNIIRMCEEYKHKYMIKSKENLDYERRLIHLTSQLERLKVDTVELSDQNHRLKADCERLMEENCQIKEENAQLRGQITELTSKASGHQGFTGSDIEKHHISIECLGHEQFLVTRAQLQDRINKSKMALF